MAYARRRTSSRRGYSSGAGRGYSTGRRSTARRSTRRAPARRSAGTSKLVIEVVQASPISRPSLNPASVAGAMPKRAKY